MRSVDVAQDSQSKSRAGDEPQEFSNVRSTRGTWATGGHRARSIRHPEMGGGFAILPPLATFRKCSGTGEIAFLDSYIWVDLNMEEFLTHNQVKAAYDYRS